MELWEYEEQQTAMQRDTREWLLGGDPNVFITLTSRAGDGMSYETAREAFGTFAHGLKCYLFAPKSKKRIHMVPVVEGYSERPGLAAKLGIRQGTHIHCLMNLPGNPLDHMEKVRTLWKNSGSVCGDPHVYCPNSSKWFLELDTVKKKRVFVNYALKTCATNTDAVLWHFVSVRRNDLRA